MDENTLEMIAFFITVLISLGVFSGMVKLTCFLIKVSYKRSIDSFLQEKEKEFLQKKEKQY